ncbi:MAG: ferrochelatase [Terriglobia bacterium]
MAVPYDALLIVSFGGPEGMDEVMPFLQNVLKGRNIPESRLREVARHYELFGGVSPINGQNRQLIASLEKELEARGPHLPVYWGNRNWHPLLADTLQKMTSDGVKRALAFVTSAYGSYSSCRQYREDIRRAQLAVGEQAPRIDKIRAFYNHPGFVEPNIENLRLALEKIPAEGRMQAEIAFTAHSIPVAMAETSKYVSQLEETSRLVAAGAGHDRWRLVYQSRSGPPSQPWLEPDILSYLSDLKKGGTRDVIVAPIGFISDHMEVIYDLDTQAQNHCHALGLNMVRAATVGTHPRFVAMIRELLLERVTSKSQRLALGRQGPSHDECTPNCCTYQPERPEPAK